MAKVIWLDLLGIIFLLAAVYFVLTVIWGHSATPIEVTLMLFLGLGTFLGSQIYKLNREVGEMKVGLKYSFNKVREDYSLIKEDLNLIKKKLRIE